MSSPRWLSASVHGVVMQVLVAPGQAVVAGQTLVVQEAMKMEIPLQAPAAGWVRSVRVAVADVLPEGAPVLEFEAAEDGAATLAGPVNEPAAAPRADLQALHTRLALTQDAARPDTVAARHAAGRRMARENLADLLDAGSFTEYGALAVAAQRSRRSLLELQTQTPADGLITGTGTVAGQALAVMAYDYTVLAGTQGVFNHQKADRLLDLALRQKLPLVLLAEGGGGRPGDVDWLGVAGLHCSSFGRLAALSGQVPLLGLVAGRCFAGNAALLGCCDLIIAAEGSSIGMGGPAMIEGGGLGRVQADDIGPVATLAAAGVVDVRVADEAAGVAVLRQLLGLFNACPPASSNVPAGGDAQWLRQAIPNNRHALTDPLRIVQTVMDAGTVIELRAEFGLGVITALARLQGRPVAVVASQPRHRGGALDAPACDKLARFMQLADARGLPLVSLVDTPGFMVGPESEAAGMVRHAGRVFVSAAALRVPVASVLLRRGFGLGAMALTAGHFHAPVATCAWPSGEFGAMGLEGAVRLGFRKELAAAPDAQKQALFDRLLADAVAKGQALNMASHLEIDAVIDPADTRAWLCRVLAVACAAPLAPRRAFIDTW